MPVENERKLLIRHSDPAQLLQTLKRSSDAETYDITQGYLSGSARIRHVVPHRSTYSDEQHLFTYKTKVGGNTVEIETEISIHDYEKLSLIVKPVVHKTRVKIRRNQYTWDIDFIKTPKSGSIYLVMAEVEMPEFETDVPEIIEHLSAHAVRWVDASDKRFNNRNLANVKKVTRLFNELTNAQ